MSAWMNLWRKLAWSPLLRRCFFQESCFTWQVAQGRVGHYLTGSAHRYKLGTNALIFFPGFPHPVTAKDLFGREYFQKIMKECLEDSGEAAQRQKAIKSSSKCAACTTRSSKNYSSFSVVGPWSWFSSVSPRKSYFEAFIALCRRERKRKSLSRSFCVMLWSRFWSPQDASKLEAWSLNTSLSPPPPYHGTSLTMLKGAY